MDKRDIVVHFNQLIKNDEDKSVGLAAIETLLKVLEISQCTTIQELRNHMQNAIEAMKMTDNPQTSIASGSELFLRFITLTNLDSPSYEECKKVMMSRGQSFIDKLLTARQRIAESGAMWIKNKHKILTNSKSRVVLKTLKLAAERNIDFHVYVVRSSDNKGEEMYNDLKNLGISCSLIHDATVGSIMRTIDYVMVGAEGVCQSGGIINKTGTFNIAALSSVMNKRFYVLAESFKFSTLFPSHNQDLPDEYKFTRSMLENGTGKDNPIVDYTPPEFIELIITDTGIFTPVAVVDQILQLYV